MIFIGDTHGKTERLAKVCEAMPEDEIFQLGDMGLGFQGVFLQHLPHFKFIRGNHDSPEACRAHKNYAGDYGYDKATGLFWLGGAWSIDAAYRIPGVSWWSDEEISVPRLAKAASLYIESKPWIVATHECPRTAASELLKELIGPYFDAKRDCANSRTARALQVMFEKHQPEHWVFGHYHIRKDFELNGTQFHCLPELGAWSVDLPHQKSGR